MTHTVRRRLKMPLLIPVLIAVGCSSNDERLVDLSRQSLNRQAEQNRLVETNNRQVIDATQRLVEADSQLRHENTQAQHEIQQERSEVDRQRDNLEHERQEIANQRNRDPIVAESIQAAVGLIVAVLPLVVCLFILRGLLHKSDDEAIADVLVEELISQQPLFVESVSRNHLEDTQSQSLPSPVAPRLGFLSKDRSVSGVNHQIPSPFHLIVVVEGSNDVEFLHRISRILHEQDAAIPDLGRLEHDGCLTFLTASTSSLPISSAALGRQFHLYDREIPPVTDERRRLIDVINLRPDCRAMLTTKRAMENYLHPDAIQEAGGVAVAFGDFEDVPDLVAQTRFRKDKGPAGEQLSRRARRKLRDKAKRWLNREAVDRMTPERLAERDPQGEVLGWLRTIGEIADVPIDARA